MAGNMITMWGITEAISGLYKLSQVSKDVAENAKELGESFSGTSSDIEDYKSKIEELYSTINDSSSSIEDVTNARKSLLSIQDELINKFGTEKNVIDEVTDAINGQTAALDRLTNSKWQETKNEFNNGGFWNDVSNSLSGYSNNIDRMIAEYGDYKARIRLNDFIDFNNVDQLEEFKELLENNFDAKITFDVSDGNSEIATLSGNASDIYEKLLDIQNLSDQFHFNDSFENSLTKLANSAQEVSNQYKEFYDQYILYEKILNKDSDYTDTFKNITDAYEKYQEAFTSNDEEKIKAAADDYAKVLTDATSTAIANGDSDVATYFENMYPTLKSIVDGWNFNIAFDANTDDLQGKVQNVLDELKDENGRSLTAEEILGLGESNVQYQALVAIAHSYNMTLEEMIELLKERNLVSAMDYQGLVGLFGQNDVDKLSPEDLEIAYTIKNVGNMTFEQLQAEIQKVKDSANEIAISPLSISQTIDQLNTRLKPAMDSLHSAWQDMFNDDGKFDLKSVDILSTCDAIKSKLDEMSDPEGLNLDVDYSAFEDFVRVLNNTESTEHDVENAFDSLSTSITQAALSGAEDFETMKAVLEDLGVVNNEMVAFQALASNTEMLEQALDEANVSMDDFIVNTRDGSVEATKAGQAFLEEKVGAENCAEALNLLAFHKQLCNLQEMNTAGEVANLRTLAENAGYTGEVIQYLTELEQIYQEVASGTLDSFQISARVVRATALKAMIEGAASKVQYAPKTDWSGAVKDAGKAGKDSGKSYKDKLKEELSDLEGVISGITGRIDDQINTIKSQKEIAVAAIDAQIDALNEQKSALEAQKKLLEEERDARIEIIEQQKKQLELAIKNIDKQIKEKEKIISGIQDEIKAMQDANAERQRQIDLQKAMYELERLQHQRTILVD